MNAAPSAPIESASAAAWPRVKLGKVCDFVYGFPFDSSSFNAEGIGARLIRIRDVVPGVTKTFTTQSCPPQYQVHDGDLLVGMDGDFNLARWKGGEAVLNQRVCMFRPKEELLLSGYLRYSLGKELRSIWESKGFSTVKHLLNKDLQSIFIPLPPLSVQREIVARLDAELAKADRMREGFLAIAENAAARFRAILAETFEGGEAGDSWPRKKLGEECEFRRGLAYPKSAEVEKSSTVVLRSNNVDLASNSLDLQELRYISDSTEVPSEKRVVPGSLLICLANGSKNHLGKVALIDQDYGYAFGGFMGLIVPKESIDSRYLYFCLASSQFKALVKSLTDGANINNLKFGDISEFSIPLPPLSVQRSVVARLDAARAECDRAEALARKGAEECAGLRAALLKEAFE